MNKIQILKRESSDKIPDENGDYLFGEKYIIPLEQKDLEDNDILLLNQICFVSWNAMIKMDCFDLPNISQFKSEIMYDCPFDTGYKFFGIFPLAILSGDVAKYRNKSFKGRFDDMAWDTDWTKSFICKKYDRNGKIGIGIPVSDIARAYMGHGYTSGTLPDDGGNSLTQVKVKLSNGDWMVCLTWIWYNK